MYNVRCRTCQTYQTCEMSNIKCHTWRRCKNRPSNLKHAEQEWRKTYKMICKVKVITYWGHAGFIFINVCGCSVGSGVHQAMDLYSCHFKLKVHAALRLEMAGRVFILKSCRAAFDFKLALCISPPLYVSAMYKCVATQMCFDWWVLRLLLQQH